MVQMMKLIIFILTLTLLYGCSGAVNQSKKETHPNCSGIEGWAASMAFIHLKNIGLLDNYTVDFIKTKIKRLASEKIGENLYVQIHFIVFTEKSGKKIQVITKNEASNDECSMSQVEVFVINNILEN